jgi:hypothetical protein
MLMEGREAGNAFITSFNGNWNAITEELQRRTEAAKAAGRTIVPPPPRSAASNKIK